MKYCPRRDPQKSEREIHDMFHDMFVHKSGLRRAQGLPRECVGTDNFHANESTSAEAGLLRVGPQTQKGGGGEASDDA